MERRWLRIFAAAFGLLVPFMWLLSSVTPSEVTVRVRNALAASVGVPADFDWTPARVPGDFLLSRAEAPDEFVRLAESLRPPASVADRDLGFALALSNELMSATKRVGSPVRASAVATYHAITRQGRGYCADFVKVFNATSLAADIPVRQWGFAFTAFGSGHTFNEIWDDQRSKWVMVDSFHSLYFVDRVSREPLSAIEVHDRLLGFDPQAREAEIVRIVPNRFPFRSDQMALDYYRSGMRQLWLVWGNNGLDFEQHPVTGPAARLSRGAGQLLGLAIGQYPTIRIYPVGVSERDLRELFRVRDELLLALACCALAALLFIPQLVHAVRGGGGGRREKRT